MRYCLNCGKCVNETANFCNNCGIPLKKKNNNNNVSSNEIVENDKTGFNILGVIFTLIYLFIYVIGYFFWSFIAKLGNGFSGKEPILTIENFISTCVISMIFSFLPCILANIFSYKSEKRNLFYFNITFMIINVFLFILDI